MTSTLTNLLSKLRDYQPFSVMVVGDFMLDEMVYGAAERLSPDAPVPVLRVDQKRTRHQAGGAANVALCLMALLGKVKCFGIKGHDEAGQNLQALLRSAGCDADGLITDPGRPTTVKRSLIGLAQHRHPQKMFRLDQESTDPLDNEIQQQLLQLILPHLDSVQVVCLEDYNKGVCSESFCRELISHCRAKGVQVLVDPASIDDYSKYTGATAITPNRTEAERATKWDTPLDSSQVHQAGLAIQLLERLDLDAVVLTLDKQGALLHERGGDPIIVPTIARSVYDVTGAGDVVLAALAAGRAHQLTWVESVVLANAAAGLEVEVFGAQPIPFNQVHRELQAQAEPKARKMRTLTELLLEVEDHREAGRTVVFTNGCFDVIHAGHIAYLRESRQQGDVLIVAVNSDEQVREQKGDGRPIYGIDDRMDILAELQCVDYLIEFAQPTVHDLLRAIQPEVYVKGGDYEPGAINEWDLIQELGLELRILAHRPGLGSTDVIKRIARAADV